MCIYFRYGMQDHWRRPYIPSMRSSRLQFSEATLLLPLPENSFSRSVASLECRGVRGRMALATVYSVLDRARCSRVSPPHLRTLPDMAIEGYPPLAEYLFPVFARLGEVAR